MARLCSRRMRRTSTALALLLLSACAQAPPLRRALIPVDAIRECLRQECEDQGLSAMSVAIAWRDQDPSLPANSIEISWGKVHTASGELLAADGKLWWPTYEYYNFPAPMYASPQHGDHRFAIATEDRSRTVIGSLWANGAPRTVPKLKLPGGDVPASPTVAAILLTEEAERLLSREQRDDFDRWGWHKVDAFRLGNSLGLVSLDSPRACVVAATDLAPATASLRRVTHRIASLLRGTDLGKEPEQLQPVERSRTRPILGTYDHEGRRLEILEVDGEPWLVPDVGSWMHLREAGNGDLVVRDLLHEGLRIRCDGHRVDFDGDSWFRRTDTPPELAPELRHLIGRYRIEEADFALPEVVVLERHGELRISTPLELTERGLSEEELADFRAGNPEVEAAPLVRIEDADGTFHIEPVHTKAELHALADAASPPPPAPDALPFDLVELRDLDPTIRYDIRYASDNNFMGFPLYDEARARMQRPAAEAVVRAHQELKKLGYGIVVHDAWRPWRITKMFWDATPKAQHTFVADPSKGSRHNRGCAIDLSLYDLATGETVQMPSGYDEFTERAYPYWPGGTSRARALRDTLRHAMEDQGFTVYEAEWWHFDFEDWQRYPVQ